MSEYDPIGSSLRRPEASADLEEVRRRFESASRPFLSSPLPWLVWAVVLPCAALLTPETFDRFQERGTLLLWSSAILVGGIAEGLVMRSRQIASSSTLARWAFRGQANLSLVGVALSWLFVFVGRAEYLPALWLLLLGHSLVLLGGLAHRALRRAGWIYQLGGFASLLPGVPVLVAFAVATAAGNLVVAVSIRRGAGSADG